MSSLTNTEEQCQCNTRQKWPNSAISLRSTPENRTRSGSEVEDDAGDGLEVVLVLAEEVVEHVIAFGPQ